MDVRPLTGADELAAWEDRLEALAARADRLLKAEATGGVALEPRIELAKDAFQVLFLSFTPEVIAASCRLTVLVSEPVLGGVPPLDQQLLAARGNRRAGVLAEALGEGTGEPLEQAVDAPALEHPAPTPEPPAAPPQRRQLRPRAERMGRRQPTVEPVAEPEQVQQLPDWITAERGELEVAELDVGEHQVGEHQADELEFGEPAHQADELELAEHQAAEVAEWVPVEELAAVLGCSPGTIRSWSMKGWLSEGTCWKKDPNNGRRYLFNATAVRLAVERRSRLLQGQAARTDEGAEQRRQLRVARQRARRQGSTEQPSTSTEQGAPSTGNRVESLLEALLAEVRADQPAC